MTYSAETEQYAQKLMEAICKDKRSTAAILIQNGTPAQLYAPDKENGSGKTALYYAVTQADTQTALKLIRKEGVRAEQLFRKEKRYGNTPLHKAIETGDTEVTLEIIAKPDVTSYHLKEIKNKDGESVWDLARRLHRNDFVAAMNKKIKRLETVIPTAIPELTTTQKQLDM